MEDATLTFSQDGIAKVVGEMQVVGSSQGESWQWSWGNPNTPDISKNKMNAVRSFGEEKRWEQLTTLFLPCDEYTGWEYASVASHLLHAIGTYRCPYEGGVVYLVILSSQFVN